MTPLLKIPLIASLCLRSSLSPLVIALYSSISLFSVPLITLMIMWAYIHVHRHELIMYTLMCPLSPFLSLSFFYFFPYLVISSRVIFFLPPRSDSGTLWIPKADRQTDELAGMWSNHSKYREDPRRPWLSGVPPSRSPTVSCPYQAPRRRNIHALSSKIVHKSSTIFPLFEYNQRSVQSFQTVISLWILITL